MSKGAVDFKELMINLLSVSSSVNLVTSDVDVDSEADLSCETSFSELFDEVSLMVVEFGAVDEDFD